MDEAACYVDPLEALPKNCISTPSPLHTLPCYCASAEADAQAPLRVVNSVAEHQAKRARSSQADAQTAKPRAPPSSLQTGTRPPAQPTQATSSTTAPSHGVHAGSPALTVDRSTNFETSQTPAVPNPGLHGAASFGEGPVPKRKGPPSVLASIVVAMDEPSGTQAGKPLKKSAKHAMADGWSLPAGLYASTHPSSSGPGSENHMQARLDSHAQAGPRIAPMSGESSNVRGRGTSCKPGFQSQGGVIAKMTSGRGRGHKGAWKKARGAQDHLSRLGGMNGSQGGVNSPIPGPGGRLPQSSSAPGAQSMTPLWNDALHVVMFLEVQSSIGSIICCMIMHHAWRRLFCRGVVASCRWSICGIQYSCCYLDLLIPVNVVFWQAEGLWLTGISITSESCGKLRPLVAIVGSTTSLPAQIDS